MALLQYYNLKTSHWPSSIQEQRQVDHCKMEANIV